MGPMGPAGADGIDGIDGVDGVCLCTGATGIPMMLGALANERDRGWTGIIDPEKAYIVVENGRITDVVFASAPNGPAAPDRPDPVLVIPSGPTEDDDVPNFPPRYDVPSGYTGPSGPFIGPTGPSWPPGPTGATGGAAYSPLRSLRGWNENEL